VTKGTIIQRGVRQKKRVINQSSFRLFRFSSSIDPPSIHQGKVHSNL
jgi:hypothetical protein